MNSLRFVIVLLLPTFAFGQTNPDFVASQKEQFEKTRVQRVMNLVSRISHDRSLQKELEIVPEQLSELTELRDAINKEQAVAREAFMKLQIEASQRQRQGDPSMMISAVQEQMKHERDLAARFFERAEAILLPHQIERLTQIVRQELFARVSGEGSFGLPLVVADELELTPQEREKLRETIETATAEYHERVEELQRQTHEKILEAIPRDKRGQLKELFGDRYDRDRELRIQRQRAMSLQTQSEDAPKE